MGKPYAEIWKMVNGSSHYAVSSKGRIVNLCTLREIKPQETKKGYLRFKVENSNQLFVHRAVAEAFIYRVDLSNNQVNHKNGNKKDNRLENLEWVTASENLLHSYHELGRKPYFLGKKRGPMPESQRKVLSEIGKERYRDKSWIEKQRGAHFGKFNRSSNPMARETLCLETGVVFGCALDAASAYGVHPNSVYQSCLKGSCVAGKYHFSYKKGK